MNKLIFKYKMLGSNFSFKPHQAPLNTHYAFAKDFKSMTRLVDVYLKDVRAQVFYVNRLGTKLDVGYKEFAPVYGAHTANDPNVNSE